MKTLKFLLSAGCVLGLELGSALGQGDSFSCTQCVCVADGSCSSESSCDGSDSDCETNTFTAECTGNYTIRYSLSCSGATCAQCFACVFLTDSDGQLIASSICHSSCQSGDCSNNCQTTVALTADQPYNIKVCKRTCFGGSCENCSSCIARGYVYIGGQFTSVCDLIPACQP